MLNHAVWTALLPVVVFLAPSVHADSPHSQFKSGIPLEEILCGDEEIPLEPPREDEKILLESPRGTPACVHRESVDGLIPRGFSPVWNGEAGIIYLADAINRFGAKFFGLVSGNHDFVISPVTAYLTLVAVYEAGGAETEQLELLLGLDPDDTRRRDAIRGLVSYLDHEYPGLDLLVWDSKTVVMGGGNGDACRSEINSDGAHSVGSISASFSGQPLYMTFEPLVPQYAEGIESCVLATDQRINVNFASSDQYLANTREFVEFPLYANEISMFLAHHNSYYGEILDAVSTGAVDAWRGEMSSTDISLVMPVFDVRSSYDLADVFGIGTASSGVDEKAGSCPDVQSIPHSASINLNTTSLPTSDLYVPDPALNVEDYAILHSSFVFAIFDDDTGTMLFMGSVTDVDGQPHLASYC